MKGQQYIFTGNVLIVVKRQIFWNIGKRVVLLITTLFVFCVKKINIFVAGFYCKNIIDK